MGTNDARIAAQLQRLLANPRLGKDVAVTVLDATAGTVIFEKKNTERQRGASTMKLVTAVNALANLGPAAVFRTQVVSSADPTHVVLKAGGDPLLSSKNLRDLADAVATQRDKTQRDKTQPLIVDVDQSLFPAHTPGPGWQKGYEPYVVAPVQALARLYDYSRDPSGAAVHVFLEQLRKDGFTVTRGADVTAAPDAAVIAENAKHTLADAVRLMLLDSENNIAENLYRHVAVARGLTADWNGARTAAEDSLRSLGIDPTELRLMDGSGVSRSDRLTTDALTKLLTLTRKTDPSRFAEMYADRALPVAGQTGTLKAAYGRFTTKASRCAAGKIRAKTGTLFDTIGLAGTTTADDGTERIFAILVNKRPQRFSKLSTRQAVDVLAATINGCR